MFMTQDRQSAGLITRCCGREDSTDMRVYDRRETTACA